MNRKKRGRRSLVWFLSLAMLFTAPGTPSVFAEEVVEESQESQEIVESEEEISESEEIIPGKTTDTNESIPEGDLETEDSQDDNQETSQDNALETSTDGAQETSPDDDQEAPQDDDQEAPSVTIQATFSGPDQTYCLDYITEGTKVTLVVRDNKGLSAVTINGILVSGSLTAGATEFTYEMSAGDRQTILATDQSGNESSLTVNVKKMHNYKQGPVEMKATCTRAAYTGSLGVCTYCGNEMLIMYRPSGSPLGHDFQETEWKLSDGTTTKVKVCSRCGILEEGFTLEGEHHWAAEYTVDKEVSCTEEGFKSIHCTDPGCDARKDITPIQSYGHRFGSYYWEKEASCTQDGIRSRDCLNCDYHESIPIKAYTHEAAVQNDCTKPTVCKWCGIVMEEAQYSEHSFGGDYKSDMVNHWKMCQNPGCYQKEKTAHSWIADEGDCTKGNQCLECGYVKAGNKDHKYGYRSNAEGHWFACDNPGCTVENKTVTKHTRNDDANCATPIYCRQCGYMVEPGGTHTLEIGYDNMNHWTECTNKGCLYSTASEAHHSSAESSDCTKGITCDSCGYQMTAPKYKAHNASGEWFTDETSHWKVCQNPGCTAVVSREEHNGELVVKENIQPATCTTPEIYDEAVFCSVCGEMTDRTENVTGAPALGHSWSEWVEVDPVESCEDSGYQERTCKICGEVEIKNINASAHEWEDDYTVDKEATCLHDGSKSIHCKNCSAVKESQVIPAAGHTYGDWIVEVQPGCDTTGLEYHICTVCGEESSRQTQVMDAIGHKWNTTYTVDKPANCTIEGSQSIHCSVCDAVKEGSAQAIPAHGHTFGVWEDITSPDCDDSGARRHTCDVCGIIETENLKPTGHDWEGEYVIDKEASCTESGSMSIHCANCDAVKDSIEIPARGHSFGAWEHVDSPTCDAAGSARHICEVCGYQETQNVAASGHDWQKGYTVDTPASCSTDGSMSIHCNNCDTVKDSQVIPALGHAFGEWEDVLSPSCDKEGSQKRTCTRCNYVDTRNVIGTGHQWEDHYTTDKQATCVEDGSESIHCANCDTVKDSRVIPALGHTFGEWEHINSPTCDAEGSERHQCTVCGYTEDRNMIPSGHSWENTYTVDVAASCTTNGSKSIHCKNCSAVKESRVIPAAGHTYGDWIVEVQPGCDTTGLEYHICTVCGEESSRQTQVMDAIGHKWNTTYTVDKPANCTIEGSQSIHCSVCDEVKEGSAQAIPAHGHTFGAWEDITSPDCDDSGARRHTCDVCGIIETENLKPTGHDWEGEYVIDKEASCTESGSMSIHCANCDAVKDSIEIPARGHSFGAWEHVDSPTCDAAGSARHICEVCGYQETQNVAASGHDWQKGYTVDTPASCSTDGSMSIHCNNCDTVKDSQVIPALGHAFGEWEDVLSPSCDKEGSQKRTCTRCNYVDIRNVIGTGHQWEDHYTTDKQATCVEDGSESIHCANCDTVKDSCVIPALGHAFGEWEDVLSPSCDKEGSQKRTCTRCNYVDTKNVIQTGHQWEDHYTTDKQATCVEDGSESIHCANCDTVKDSQVIPALGHAFGEWEHINSPTCDAEGSERHQCTVCGYTEDRNMIPFGHSWENTYTVDVAASCTTDGSESIHCSRCDTVKDSRVIPASGHSFTYYVMTGDRSEVAFCDNEGCEATDTRSNYVQVEDETDSINANTGDLDLEEILEENGLDRYTLPIEIILSQGTPEEKDTESLKEILTLSPEASGYEFADAFEVRLSLFVDGVNLGNITKDFGTLMLSFFVGRNNANRPAVIFQMHGEDILTPYTDLIVNDEGYVTITVDKLSAFAVAVGKKAETTPPQTQPDPPTQLDPSTSETAPTPEEEKVQPIAAASSPKTGDEDNACGGLFLLLAGAALVLTGFRRYQRYH